MNTFFSPNDEDLSWKASPVGAIEAQKSQLKYLLDYFKLKLPTITTKVVEDERGKPSFNCKSVEFLLAKTSRFRQGNWLPSPLSGAYLEIPFLPPAFLRRGDSMCWVARLGSRLTF